MTDESNKKPGDPGLYRESPPDAPPPAPVGPSEFELRLQAEAEARALEQRARASGSRTGCLWVLAVVGVGILVFIGLVTFTCSR